jgi:hypothetical protein
MVKTQTKNRAPGEKEKGEIVTETNHHPPHNMEDSPI